MLTKKDINKLRKYLKRNNITTIEQAIVEDYGGIMIDTSEDYITDMAVILVERELDNNRFQKLFSEYNRRDIERLVLDYSLQGQTLDEIWNKAKQTDSRVLKRDIARIKVEAYRNRWYDLADELEVVDPINPAGFQFFKKLVNESNIQKVKDILGGHYGLD
jgi:hypothetical protein